MRHDQIADHSTFDEVELRNIWPSGGHFMPAPTLSVDSREPTKAFLPTPAATEVPTAVGKLIVASYAALIGALAVATVGSRDSAFVIAIAAFFALMFFGVPTIMLRVESDGVQRPSLDQFMRQGLQTFTGHTGGRAALAQILIVPVSLTLPVLAIGVAASFII